jgi:hypothetical protein
LLNTMSTMGATLKLKIMKMLKTRTLKFQMMMTMTMKTRMMIWTSTTWTKVLIFFDGGLSNNGSWYLIRNVEM